MKKNKSTNFFYINIDTDLVVRNMVFFVFFVLFLGISIDSFLFPVIERYKSQTLDERKEKIVLAQVQKDFEAAQSALIRTKKANDEILSTMSYNFSQDRFKDTLSKYFSHIEVNKNSSSKDIEKQVQDDIYFLRAEAKNLDNLNKFFADLQKAQASIKILLPITIKKSAQSNGLIVELYLNVEKSSYKPQIAL